MTLTPDWTEEFPGNIAVCDPQGVLLALNAQEARFFESLGGKDLIGFNMANCHSQASNEKIAQMMASQKPNIYTVTENGKTELIIQSPWYQGGQFAGLVEIAIELHGPIPHIDR